MDKNYVLVRLANGEMVMGIEAADGDVIEPWIMLSEVDMTQSNQSQGTGTIRPFPMFFPIEAEEVYIPKDKVVVWSTPPQTLIDFYEKAKTKVKSKIVSPDKELIVPK